MTASPDNTARPERGGHLTTLSAPFVTGENLETPAAVREALAVLAWYADEKNWESSDTSFFYGCKIALDGCGRRARAALARLDETRKGAA